ncbi:hypothetical protein GC176_26635 [bacterium]|nr:hypothetical protein [bacterium]
MAQRRGEVSGSIIVALMFTFGALTTGALWTYWFYHTQPFIPLQQAISAEFKGSAPRVDGGARKLHKGTPKLLWIIMRVDFRPNLDREKSASVSRRVVELSQENLDLTKFEQLNIRLFFGELEKEIHTLDAEVPIHAGQPDLNAVTAESLKQNAKAESMIRPGAAASAIPKNGSSTREPETGQ